METVYQYRFKGQMQSSMESIPLGNGDLGVNAWAKEGSVFLMLSKTDAWSELHRLLKLGLLQISFTPNPFTPDTEFLLELKKGLLTIRTGDDFTLRLWVDANHPVYHLEVDSQQPLTCTVSMVNYRDRPYYPAGDDHSNYLMSYTGLPEALVEEVAAVNYEGADETFFPNPHAIGQYHHNRHSVYPFTMKHQGVEGFQGNDPLTGRIFGYLVSAPTLTRKGETLEGTEVHNLRLEVAGLTTHGVSPAEWKTQIEAIHSPADSFDGHIRYWESVWEKSYIHASGDKFAQRVTQQYAYQRYLNLCAGKGAYPIKFNGSIFTMEPSPHHIEKENYDYRKWGGLYWFQNTRLVYWSMLYAGDYELIAPFLRLYLEQLPFSRYRTQEYYSFDGAFLPETMTIFGCYANPNYGWDRRGKAKGTVENHYIRWYYSGMLEFSQFLLEYVRCSGQREFLEEALPFVEQVLTFFVNRYERCDGKLVIAPGMSLETWQHCVDDTPTISGLQAVVEGVLAVAPADSRVFALCKELAPAIPDLNYENKNGHTLLSPCRIKIDQRRRNVENPEMYPVFPYRQFRVGKKNTAVGIATYHNREIKSSCGWQQHGIQAALLGLAEEAEKELAENYRNTHPKCAFPAFWGPNYDWTPDQDNGGAANTALLQMLLQTDETRIDLLPAWDKKRDVCFRLPVGGGNFLTFAWESGRVKAAEFDFPPVQRVYLDGAEFLQELEAK